MDKALNKQLEEQNHKNNIKLAELCGYIPVKRDDLQSALDERKTHKFIYSFFVDWFNPDNPNVANVVVYHITGAIENFNPMVFPDQMEKVLARIEERFNKSESTIADLESIIYSLSNEVEDNHSTISSLEYRLDNLEDLVT